MDSFKNGPPPGHPLYRETEEKIPMGMKTPSECAFPVFVLCQPTYVDTSISNNGWMKKLSPAEKKIDKEKFMAQWFNLYKLISFNALVYLVPPRQGLQDQTYMNCAAYLPHLPKKNIIILSNFRAPGRAGEEDVAGELFRKLGYTTIRSPYYFEGEPELKYLRENIYFGGWGIRTDIRAHKWMAKTFDANIIPVRETDEMLYHLDCSLFVVDKQNVIICADVMDKETVKEIEKVAYVHRISKRSAYEGICNSVRMDDFILNSSSLDFLQKRDPKYQEEKEKNTQLEDICHKLGLEIVYTELSEAGKSGAALSCFAMHLNYPDQQNA